MTCDPCLSISDLWLIAKVDRLFVNTCDAGFPKKSDLLGLPRMMPLCRVTTLRDARVSVLLDTPVVFAMVGTSLGAFMAPRLGARAGAPRRVGKHVPNACVSDNVGNVRGRSGTRGANKPRFAGFVPSHTRSSSRFTSTHRVVTTPGAIANPKPEPPKESVEEPDAREIDETYESKVSSSESTGIVVQAVEPSAFHSMDDEFEQLKLKAEADAHAALEASRPKPLPPSRIVIVGGGPTGLSTAIMLARRGWKNIEVWERLQKPPSPDDTAVWGDPSRSYNVGLSGRGQIALEKLGVCDQVLNYCKRVNGRMDWTPESRDGKIKLTDKKYATQVIQRDRLVAVLLREVTTKYTDSITVFHGTTCANVEWLPGGGATLVREPTEFEADEGEVSGRFPENAGIRVVEPFVPFVVGAEGATSRNAVLNAMDSDTTAKCGTKIKRFEDKNPRVYKTVPINLPSDKFRNDLNYSARTKAGVALECLPTREGVLVGILLVKPGDTETCEKLTTKSSLRKYFDGEFPMFAEYIADEDLELMANRRLSTLPSFAHAGGNSLHRVDGDGSRITEESSSDVTGVSMGKQSELGGAAILGDSIHCVKPYFGLGVNSAFEDVTVLDRCFDDVAMSNQSDESKQSQWLQALPLFSSRRAADAKALVDISRGFDGGFLTFVLPLILDGIFHKALPQIFYPNTIQMLQKEDWTFSQVASRKSKERVAQVGILSAVFSVFMWGAVQIARAGARMIAGA